MLDKIFGVIYFHFNIFSEKSKNKKRHGLKFAFLGYGPKQMLWDIFCVMVPPSALKNHRQHGICRSFLPS